MSLNVELIDRKALHLHRRRAVSTLHRELFLHREAQKEIEHRLKDINRSFKHIAIVTGHKKFWKTVRPNARVVTDDERLEFSDKRFDLIIHAMSLHWSNDPVGQLIQCRRALVPDGLLLAVCLGGETLIELRRAFLDAEILVKGGASPRVAPMGDVRDYGSLLQRAAFALPVTDRLALKANYSTAMELMRDLRAMGENNALAARLKTFSSARLFRSLEEIYRHSFAAREGLLTATFELIFLTGWAPSDKQQKALLPGSAKSRLADALNTVEQKLDR